MRLTKSTSHAIRILLECARASDQLVKVAVLSERLDITQQNIFKMINVLAKAGLIGAVRGRNGGVRLALPASAIRIGDVVRACEVTRVAIDTAEGGRTQGRSRDVNRILDDALGAFIDVLDQHTLADMAKGQRQAAPAPRRSRGSGKAVAGAPPRTRRALLGH